LSLKLPLLTKSKVKLGSLLLAVAWKVRCQWFLKIEIFIVVFVIIDFLMVPFTVASAVLDLIQILWWHFQLFCQTNYFWWVFPNQNCWVLFWHYIFLYFLFFDQIRPSVCRTKTTFQIRSVEKLFIVPLKVPVALNDAGKLMELG
jgi:hypothetical protein